MSVLESELILKTEIGGILPRFSGVMARGMFLNTIKEQFPDIAEQLHKKDQIQKYAISEFKRVTSFQSENSFENMISSIHKRKNKRKDNILKAGDLVKIKIISAEPTLSAKLPVLFQQKWFADKDKLTFSPYKYESREISPVNLFLEQNPVRIQFTSPVSFTRGSVTAVFPEGELLLKNLSAIWNTWFPNKIISDELLNNLLQHVQISSAKGSVISHSNGKGSYHRGWIGAVSYYFSQEEYHTMGSILLHFGSFSGAGRGRTAGFGRFFINEKI